ncbi:MAG: hypothetical protein E7052_00020 [Lentisphaerae bacterium]|nr:hypothetical protein [Lentisphaerota bacterium]
MKKQHFNLMELSVVIGLTAMIATVLAPAISASQQGAKGMLCSDNLKKLGQLQQAYLESNDDFFTPAMDTSFKPTLTVNGQKSTSKSFAKWPYFILTTQKTATTGADGWALPQEFHCPARSKSQFSSFQYDCYAKLDYGMNYAFSPAKLNGLYQNIAQVEDPATLIMFADAKQISWPNDTGSYQIPCRLNKFGAWGKLDVLAKMDENVFLGHGGAHVSYTDGHVEMIPVKAGNTLEGRQEFWQNTYLGKKNLWYGRNN